MKQQENYFIEMKKEIAKAGNLFYQYRPCRRDVSTIYDIENIQHDVVYARTPLCMNDPFDSKIGFSSKKIYEESISYIMDILPPQTNEIVKTVLEYLLKYKLLGQLSELFVALNELKLFLKRQQKALHKQSLSLEQFTIQCANVLYSRCPKAIKNYIAKTSFNAICRLVVKLVDVNINAETLEEFLHINSLLSNYQNQIETLRDNVYIPSFKDFLSKLTISCFSISGWNNPLMWSHYANSYEGICIEYDFSKIKDFVGFIKKVDYSSIRPTVMLKDLGVSGLRIKDDGPNQVELVQAPADIEKILTYLLVKDKFWDYEKEWRIINIEKEPFNPTFVDLPCIKSVTFGVNVDSLCRRLLIDICREKSIECFDLVLSNEDFSMDRKKIDFEALTYNENEENHYFNLLLQEVNDCAQAMTESADLFTEEIGKGNKNCLLLIKPLEKVLDYFCNSYFLKLWLNRSLDNINLSGSENDSEELLGLKNSLANIDESILKNLEEVENLEDVVTKFRQEFFDQDLKKINKIIKDIDNIGNKYKILKWHTVIGEFN